MLKMWKSDLHPGHEVLIMRTCLALSIVLHALLFLTFQKTSLFQWIPGELRTYQVELLRPPVENMDFDEATQTDIASVKGDRSSSPGDDQETITLDTEDKRYVAYAGIIKERIMRQWTYPPEAKARLVEGKLALRFSLNRQGQMMQIDIMNPSGFSLLDKEAIRAVSAAAPYPPFPDHITVSRLNIEASFDYRLTTKR